MIAIGVDPGKNTGFAVWDCEAQEFIELMTYTFWEAYSEGLGWKARAEMDSRKLIIYVEDPQGNKPTFGRNKLGKKQLDRKAQNVGMNKKEAQLLVSGWRRAGIAVKTIVPKSSKWSAQMFKNLSGWPHQTNEHQRDAAKMVIGMRPMPDMQYEQLKQEVA